MTTLDRYDQAKQQAAQLKPGRYLMSWKVGKGSARGIHSREVVLEFDGDCLCFCYLDEVGTEREFFSPVYVAIAAGTTFTEVRDEHSLGRNGNPGTDLSSLLCFVFDVACGVDI